MESSVIKPQRQAVDRLGLIRAGAIVLAIAALPSSARADGYSACQGPHDDKPHLVCGHSCPQGETFISWSPNQIPQCTTILRPGCNEIKNLHYDLGWNEGHKTNFCKAHGFDGMTNHPNTSYKQHGGGWCYKGDNAACTASLPNYPP
jgi:hypothetical protein